MKLGMFMGWVQSDSDSDSNLLFFGGCPYSDPYLDLPNLMVILNRSLFQLFIQFFLYFKDLISIKMRL